MLLLGVLSIQTSLYASYFASLSYAPKSEDRTLEEESFKDLSYVKLKIGSIGYTQGLKRFGFYVDFAGQLEDKDNKKYNEDVRGVDYRNYLVNVGTTWSLSDHIVLFGGAGVDYQRMAYMNNQKDDIKKNKLNLNGGLMFFHKSYGLTTEFDSANKAMSFGLTYKF